MNRELMEALDTLEREKSISKITLLGAIEQSLIQACKNHFGKADNVHVSINPETCDFSVYADRTVVEFVEDPALEISLTEAQKVNTNAEVGDVVKVEIQSRQFGRIATQNAKNVILQKIREEERKVLFDQYYGKEKEVVTGIIQRVNGRNVSVNLGKADAILSENEQVKGEEFRPTERVKVYILEVKDTPKGPRILVSRTHPGLVKRLFESEVAEVKDGTVEIRSIAREPGSRTKIAVWSNDPDVDPVGACVGINGARVGAIVNELKGEKIDIINWDENPAILIENALSPAKVIAVMADPDEKTALVVVPDYQLSLAIGKEGQNARLAARLTGFKIDIKSETQARESGELYEYEDDEYYEDEEGYGEENYGEENYGEGYGPEGYEGDYGQEDYSGYDPESYGPEGYAQEGGSPENYDGGYDQNGYEQADYPGEEYGQGYDQENASGEEYGQAGYDPEGYPEDAYSQAGYDQGNAPGEEYDQTDMDQTGYGQEEYDGDGYAGDENYAQDSFGEAAYASEDAGQADGTGEEAYDGGYEKTAGEENLPDGVVEEYEDEN